MGHKVYNGLGMSLWVIGWPFEFMKYLFTGYHDTLEFIMGYAWAFQIYLGIVWKISIIHMIFNLYCTITTVGLVS